MEKDTVNVNATNAYSCQHLRALCLLSVC